MTPLSRRTFRAEIVGFNPQPDPPGKWAVTLEVVDRLTGRTSLLLGNPDTLPAESLAPAGAVSIGAMSDTSLLEGMCQTPTAAPNGARQRKRMTCERAGAILPRREL